MSIKSKTAVVASTTSLGSTRGAAGDVVSTLGYHAAYGGVGAATYRYLPTGRSTHTPDSVLYWAGPGSDDYWELLHNGVIDVTQAGAVGDGVTDDTDAIQSVWNLIGEGGSMYIPSGTYLVTSLTAPDSSNNWLIRGDGDSSLIVSAENSGGVVVDLNDAEHFALKSFKVTSTIGGTTVRNFVGIDFNGANRWSVEDVTVFNASLGVDFADAFIGTIDNLFIRYGTTGFTATALNSVSGSIKVENVAKGFSVTNSLSLDLNLIVEGAARTQSSTIDGCYNTRLVLYAEDQSGTVRAVPEVVVGGTTECQNLELVFNLGNLASVVTKMLTIDRVDGMQLTAYTVMNTSQELYSVTANTKNLSTTCINDTSDPPRPCLVPASLATSHPVNLWVDPFFEQGIPTLSVSSATVAEETTIKPDFATRSLKVTSTGTTTANFAHRVYTFADFPHLAQLKGKKVGVAYWVYYDSGANYTPGSGGNGPDCRLLSNGSPAGNTSNRYEIHYGGAWFLQTAEMTIPADATQITIYYYSNRGVTNSDETMIAYFVGPLVWIGGYSNVNRVINGYYSHHPLALNRQPVISTATDGDTTPTVAGIDVLIFDNTSSEIITDLDDGYNGKLIEVHLDTNTTLNDSGGTFKFDSSVGGPLDGGSGGKVITLRLIDGVWTQVGAITVF